MTVTTRSSHSSPLTPNWSKELKPSGVWPNQLTDSNLPETIQKPWERCRSVSVRPARMLPLFFLTFLLLVFYSVIPKAACLLKMFACVKSRSRPDNMDLVPNVCVSGSGLECFAGRFFFFFSLFFFLLSSRSFCTRRCSELKLL